MMSHFLSFLLPSKPLEQEPGRVKRLHKNKIFSHEIEDRDKSNSCPYASEHRQIAHVGQEDILPTL